MIYRKLPCSFFLALLLVGMIGWQSAHAQLLKKSDIPKTIALLKTGTPKQKISAAEALGRRGAVRQADVKEAVTPLKYLFEKDADSKVRAAAAIALGRIAVEPKDTVQLLLKSLKDEKTEDEVKMGVIIAMGSIGPEARAAMPELRKIAQDKEKKRLSRTARDIMKNMRAQ